MLYMETLHIRGNGLPGENPLPFFRNQQRSTPVAMQDSVRQEDRELLGYETGDIFLPYRKKDRYDRVKKELAVKTVVLENETLKAVFLPQYGGRLYSLFDKKLGRELLFKNPVLQTANLAILDAWISGGIEWNVGQMGHTFTTCAPVFMGRMRDGDGVEFLRMYEYERCRALFWQADFHLPPGSGVLQVYVRIVNDQKCEKPLYWWTNTAVPQTKELRIFSGADEVLYLDNGINGYGRSAMSVLPVLPGVDASYPARIKDSCEYFFQTQGEERAPWEAAVYPDHIFAETSTARLKYRKMFCWGTRDSGRHWQDYLSEPGKGEYVEIQAGLSRTQRHGGLIGAGESVEFAQCFGGLPNGGEFYGENWREEKERLGARIREWMPQARVEETFRRLRSHAGLTPEELLYTGSGFGALEGLRREVMGESPVPGGFLFPRESMGPEQKPWVGLLRDGVYRESRPEGFPASYCVEESFAGLLEKAAGTAGKTGGGMEALPALFQLSVIYIESGRWDKGEEVLKRALGMGRTAPVCRNLAYLYDKKDMPEKASALYEEAAKICLEEDRGPLLEEYFAFLHRRGDDGKILSCHRRLPEILARREGLLIPAAFAALNQGEYQYAEQVFHREYADIRENAVDLYVIWNRYHLLRMRDGTKRDVTMEEVKRRYPVPYELDFRMKDV